MKLDEFFAINNVFTFKELKHSFFIDQDSFTKNSTLYNLLTYHEKQGHILRIRRGLYHSVPKGLDSAQCPVDSFLLARNVRRLCNCLRIGS